MKGCLAEVLAAGALLFCILWGLGAGIVGGAVVARYFPSFLGPVVAIVFCCGGLASGLFVGFLCLDYLQRKFNYLGLTSHSDSQKSFTQHGMKEGAIEARSKQEATMEATTGARRAPADQKSDDARA